MDFLRTFLLNNYLILIRKKRRNKNIFNNLGNHILTELGFELQKKRKQYKDRLTGKIKEYNNYTIGTC